MSYALHAASILAHFRKSFKVYLRVGMKLKEPKAIQRSEGKAVRVVDRRKAL
jgi:phenylacetate-coenzyme A ligase PaaK-like adenylate-forming protein